MKKSNKEIFLFSLERKDVACLHPLLNELKKISSNVFFTSSPFSIDPLDIFDRDVLRRFMGADFPIAVISSSGMRELISLFRPSGTYDVVNIEHGVAPFKRYTYGPHLLESEHYIAPSNLWAERLQRLYPDQAHKVRVGGFPRLEVLRELRKKALSKTETPASPDPRLAKWRAASGERKLVILSWGAKAEELDKLPDNENIAYLYHPADMAGLAARKSGHCSLFLSTPELATYLLCEADRVYGDFSSLTLESLALGVPTYIYIERNFYVSNCDLGEEFFDRDSPDFGRIPETDYRLDTKLVLDGSQLAAALDDTAADIRSFTATDLPAGLLPPNDCDNRKLTAQLILEITQGTPAPSSNALPTDRSENFMFVLDAYLQVLGRPADPKGMRHYLAMIESSAKPRPLIAMEILHVLATSKEGKRRFSSGDWRFPKIEVAVPKISADSKST